MLLPPPSSRRAMLILSEHDIERCEIEGETKILYDDEVYVLQLPVHVTAELPLAIKNIIDSNLDRTGTILVQNPFNTESYDTYEDAAATFPLHKYMLFSHFCQALGAKEVKIEQIDISSEKGSAKYSLQGERCGVKGNISVNHEHFEKIRSGLMLNDTFKGGNPDFMTAENVLRKAKLYADPNMITLLEARKITSNPILGRNLTVDLTKETKSNLAIAASIGIPKIIKMKADYKKSIDEINEYKLTVRVTF